jgi:hypothetical protein
MMHNSAVTEISFSPDPEIQQLNFHEHLPEHLKIDPVPRDKKT